MIYSFTEKFEFSNANHCASVMQLLRELFPHCADVKRTDAAKDKTGTDFEVILRNGSIVNIDHKVRTPGCAAFWKHGCPEVALETWSVVPEQDQKGKVGWTLDESKSTHYTLHTFDKTDSHKVYLFPFQLLRIVFRRNHDTWRIRFPSGPPQESVLGKTRWKSRCIFVPVSIIISELSNAMRGDYRQQSQKT